MTKKILIVCIISVLIFGFKTKTLTPNEWRNNARQIADTFLCSLFKINSVDSAFYLNSLKSGYDDTTIINKKETKRLKQKIPTFVQYKNGINYIPVYYYFWYSLKNDFSDKPYFMCIGITKDLKPIKFTVTNLIKIHDVRTLPTKKDFMLLVKQYNLNPKTCDIYYMIEPNMHNVKNEYVLLLKQRIGTSAPAYDGCDSSYITKSIYINPWTKQLLRMAIDTNQLCI